MLTVALGGLLIALAPVVSALWGLLAPLLPIMAIFAGITAGVAALVLVVDDLATYFKGGDSVFGRFLKSIDEVKKNTGKDMLGMNFGNPLGIPALGLLPSMAGSGGTMLQTIRHIIEISVTGKGLMGSIADEVAERLKREMRWTDSQMRKEPR
jgi:hypothetical protein